MGAIANNPGEKLMAWTTVVSWMWREVARYWIYFKASGISGVLAWGGRLLVSQEWLLGLGANS